MNIKQKFYHDINKVKSNNRKLHTQAARTQAIKHDSELVITLAEIAFWSKHVDGSTTKHVYNPYHQMLHELAIWVTSPKTKGHNKNYKNHFRKNTDLPTEINDNMKTNHRIYTGDNNYFKGGDLMPKKSELKNNPTIAKLHDYLIELDQELKRNAGNRIKISRAIRQTHNDLNEAILSHRGLNHHGRDDNTISPKSTLNVPSRFTIKYITTLMHYSLSELKQNNIRLDKMDVNTTLDRLGYTNDPILNDIEQGYSQSETAQRHNLNQSNISRKFYRIVNETHEAMNN